VKPKILVTRPLPRAALEGLASNFEVEIRPQDAPLTPEQLAVACRDVEGLLVAGVRVTEEVLKAAEKLRAVSNAGVGYDNIDVAGCTARKIPVTNTAGVLEETTADLAFALLLAVARRIVEGHRYIKQDRWHRWQWGLLQGADVHHKTLGVYGFGRIGQAVARRGHGFSMRVLYYQRHRAPEAAERESEARYVDRETLLRESDFLSLHVPLTTETTRAISTNELALMKPTAFLINTARGKVVDEGALVEALEHGRLAGAGLDVFEREPHLHPGLEGMKNVVFAPHIGSATVETRFRMAKLAAENLADMMEGRRPANLINPEVFVAST
jgi:glyoxylate reductase